MSFIKTDLTKLANLNKSKGTGSIRKSKPEYVDFFPPCNNACPAGENIQEWLSLAQEGKIEDAWRKLTSKILWLRFMGEFVIILAKILATEKI